MGATGQAEGSMATTTCLSMVVVAMSDGRIFNGLPEDKSYKQPTWHHMLPHLLTLHSARLPAFSFFPGGSRGGTHPSVLRDIYGHWTLHLLGNMFTHGMQEHFCSFEHCSSVLQTNECITFCLMWDNI